MKLGRMHVGCEITVIVGIVYPCCCKKCKLKLHLLGYFNTKQPKPMSKYVRSFAKRSKSCFAH